MQLFIWKLLLVSGVFCIASVEAAEPLLEIATGQKTVFGKKLAHDDATCWVIQKEWTPGADFDRSCDQISVNESGSFGHIPQPNCEQTYEENLGTISKSRGHPVILWSRLRGGQDNI